MRLNKKKRIEIKKEVVERLRSDLDIKRIVIFGSFLYSDAPNDIDVAVFQTSSEKYLPLALKYRKRLDRLAQKISLDIIPLKFGATGGYFMGEIEKGEVLYEKT